MKKGGKQLSVYTSILQICSFTLNLGKPIKMETIDEVSEGNETCDEIEVKVVLDDDEQGEFFFTRLHF